MKQFFKFVFATIIGIIISSFLLVIILIGIVSVATSGDKSTEVASNSVLRIALSSSIAERTPDNPLAELGF